ncbi:NACHT, LRR and PYD domains-containing protein 3-like [Stegastes partitus]|uniref:NACHT, LRR and PYD domains-containing protein 3-like n=1 Tax=Stegastes partitus TaxID=144197 RepID=A0A9Y4N7K4_9TELE|nr:PREDICTED: NACHT, LRR and PYD domains-containing protein 3-like [Stegastes partitus]
MVQAYSLHGALRITAEVLRKISRNDLVECIPQSDAQPGNAAADVGETLRTTGAGSVQQAVPSYPPAPELQAEDLLVQGATPPQPITSYQRVLQSNLHNKYMCVLEGSSKQKDKKLLDDIYTELYIIDGKDEDVSRQHEVRHVELAPRRPQGTERSIQHNDIFKHPSGENTPVRTVLTHGIAGIGKTFLVHKFILDWAEGRANQDMHLTFLFTFRQLNLLRGRRFRLAELIHKCIRESQDIEKETLNYIFRKLQTSGNTNYDKSKFKLLFVLDGLDESRLHLNFCDKDECSADEPLLVNELLSNLIQGKLLPAARLWITTRPAAANQIPLDFVDIMTEVRGFTDPQKEEYFRKRFRNEQICGRIISHVRTSQSLHMMCHIPVFCWITATVLTQMLGEGENKEIPQTLTEMYAKFLVFQIKQTAKKYGTNENMKIIKSLAKLAFHQLEKRNLIFYETDLKNSGIHLSDASVYSGVFTQIFQEEDGLNADKMFSFVHLSIHEFLAAVFVVLSLVNDSSDVMAEPQTLLEYLNMLFQKASATEVYKKAVDKALQSPNGHLDLFLRFLLGLSLESNQTLLRGLLKQKANSKDTNQELVKYIKKKIRENPSPERCINLLHCLSELMDSSLVDEIQHYLRAGSLSTAHVSPVQWSALVYVLLLSEKELDVFDLQKYSRSEEVLLRLLPLVKVSTTALLSQCELSHSSCEALASTLSSQSSSLRELDLSYNNIQDAGVKLLSAGLESPHCKLETLRLSRCKLTSGGCAPLASALNVSPSRPKDVDHRTRNPGAKQLTVKPSIITTPGSCELCLHSEGQYSSLRELDLSNNDLQDAGVKQLSAGLESPHCRLENLRLSLCWMSEKGCDYLASVFRSKPSSLRKLDLSNNDLGDPGVQLLSVGLESSYCRLESLSLSGCLVTEQGCGSLASALSSNPSHMRELDLSYNHPGESGVKLLSAGLEDPQWRLDTLRVDHCGESRMLPGPRKCKYQ